MFAKIRAKNVRREYTNLLKLTPWQTVYVLYRDGKWHRGYVTRIIKRTGRIYVRLDDVLSVKIGFYPNAGNFKTRMQYETEFGRQKRYTSSDYDRRTCGDQSDYDILGVPRDATREQIRNAYRELCLKFHPDRPNGDEEKMKQINAAYSRLVGGK